MGDRLDNYIDKEFLQGDKLSVKLSILMKPATTLRFLKEPSQIQMLIRKPKKRRKKTEQLSAQVQLDLHLEYLNFVGPTYIKDYYQVSFFLWRPTYKCVD